jgi:hypothetical protein
MAAVRPSLADDPVPSRHPSRASNGDAAGKASGPLHRLGALFTRPLKIKRVGKQLHVVLDDAPSTPTPSRSGGRGEALRLAHVALQELLAQHEDARRLVPHLSHLEQTLAKQGSRALKMLPAPLLNKAMDQLDMLEGTSQSDDLITLRLRVAEAVKVRTPARRLPDEMSSLEVTHVSHSQFDEADRRWTAAAPLDDATPVLQGAK